MLGGDRPGDEFNQDADWGDLLGRHGWTFVFADATGTEYWRRPGKSIGVSATVNYGGAGRFYVFSENAHPLESNRSYSKFEFLAAVEFGGDFSAASRWLSKPGLWAAGPTALRSTAERKPRASLNRKRVSSEDLVELTCKEAHAVIKFQSRGGRERLIAPVFACDVCGEAITDVGAGAVVFRGLGVGEDELLELMHVHKGRCHDRAEARMTGSSGPWHELSDHVSEIIAEVGIDVRESPRLGQHLELRTSASQML